MDYQVIQKAKPKEMKVKPNNTLADFFTQFIIIYEVAEYRCFRRQRDN